MLEEGLAGLQAEDLIVQGAFLPGLDAAGTCAAVGNVVDRSWS